MAPAPLRFYDPRTEACIRFKTAEDLALDVVGQIVATIPKGRWIEIAKEARRRQHGGPASSRGS